MAFDPLGAVGRAGEKWGEAWMGESQYSPEAKTIDTGRGDQERALGLESRGQQQQLGQYYQDRMAGKGPSVAEMQQARGLRQAMAVGAAGRGTNVAMAQRNAANVAQQGVADTSMLRAQEQAQAAKQYSDLVQAQRMQDLLARGYSVEEAKAQLEYYGNIQAAKLKAASEEAERKQKGAGGIFTAAGRVVSSDEQLKEDIQPVGTGMPSYSRDYRMGGAFMSPGQMGGPSAGAVPAESAGTQVANAGLYNNAHPAIRTSGGGPITQQMDRGQGDWYGVSDYSPEQPPAGAPIASGTSGPSFLQRIGNGMMAGGGSLTGDYGPLLEAIKQQQADRDATKQAEMSAAKPSDEEGGGEGKAKIAGALMALSDETSKKEIQNLRAENSLLKGAMTPGLSGAQSATAQPRHPQTPEQYQEGVQAFNRLDKSNKPMANLVFQTTIPPGEVKANRADVHKAAASDYMRAYEQWQKALLDKQQDLKAMEQAAAIEQGRVPTPSAAYPPGQMGVDEMRAARAQRMLSDVNSKQVMSDVSAKEPYPSDERMKQDMSPLLTAIKARGKEMTGDAMQQHEYPALTEQAAEIPAITFRYKEGMGEDTSKRYTGTTAQALEKIPATAPAVINGPDGLKRVDAGQLTMTNTAMISDLARRMEAFEKAAGVKTQPKKGKVTVPSDVRMKRAY